MAQQTAVEWLVNELNLNEIIEKNNLLIVLDIINQAKAMEKKQIEIAYKRGYINGVGETELANSVKNINK
jgi:hypothetical protein